MKIILLTLALFTPAAFAAESNLTTCRVQEIVGDEKEGGKRGGETIAEHNLEFKFADPSELGKMGDQEISSKKYPGLKLQFFWGTSHTQERKLLSFFQSVFIQDEARGISLVDMVDHYFTKEGNFYRLPRASFRKVYNMSVDGGLDRMVIECATNEKAL